MAVKLFRVGFVVENGVSSTKSVACVRIPVPMGAVRDLKFIDDYSLMLAFVGIDDVSCLVKLSYRFSEQSGHDLRYRHVSLAGVTDADESSRNMSGEACGIDLTKPNEVSLHAVHQFPAGKMWTPQKLEINGRKGRRMVCVLAEDRHHYRQFDLDSLATSHDKTAGDDENGHHDADMTAS
ncbi:MAG: hypothetical protein L6R40_000924 [Gallowayella cf. fulva]|nr:MAG: hypothetical protein L6R40_000924 [Xanthomendoza cf. fulva]